MTLQQRAARAVQTLMRERGWGAQRRIADAAGIPPSSMTRVVKGQQPVTLAILDAIERTEGVNALALLAGRGDTLRPVTEAEWALLSAVRGWPASVREALQTFVQHFSDEPPEDRDLRRAAPLFRELSERQRHHVLAHMTMLREGLPRDLEVALRLPAAAPPPPAPAPDTPAPAKLPSSHPSNKRRR